MRVYRLSKEKYARDLSGKGAERIGGRWNSKGVPMLYTANSRALCVAEIAVHVPLGILPIDYCLVSLEIPDDSIGELSEKLLPDDWKSFPHVESTQQLGNKHIAEQGTLALKVPSAVVQGECNYLLNPLHARFAEVKLVGVEPFEFDGRLFGLR
jgi:RES domain-containing protein